MGFTALHLAAQNGHVSIARELLDHGADPTVVNEKGAAPLHIAAAYGRLEVLELLLGQEH